MIKISIVVPVYNVENYVKKCIDSILAQTHQNFEVIVIDDCSPDKSVSILRAYESGKISIYSHDENKGLSASRNTGVKYCSGDYLLFLDSDDVLLPHALEKCASIVRDYSSDIVSFNSHHIDEDGQTWPVSWHENYSYTDCYNIGIENYPKLVWDVAAWNKLINLKFYRENHLLFDEDQKWFEDHLFSIQMYSKTSKVSLIDDVLHHYLKRSNITNQSITQQKSFLTSHYRLRMMESVLSYLHESGNKKVIPYFFELIFSVYKSVMTDAYESASSKESFDELIGRLKNILNYCDSQTIQRFRLESVDLALCIKYLNRENVISYFDSDCGPRILLDQLFLKTFREKDYYDIDYKQFKKYFHSRTIKKRDCLWAMIFVISQPIFLIKHLLCYGISYSYLFFRKNLGVYTIVKSRSLDVDYYSVQSGLSFITIRSAAMHYVFHGERLGLRPNSLFSASLYLKANLDLKRWEGNLFAHYLRHGLRKGRVIN